MQKYKLSHDRYIPPNYIWSYNCVIIVHYVTVFIFTAKLYGHITVLSLCIMSSCLYLPPNYTTVLSFCKHEIIYSVENKIKLSNFTYIQTKKNLGLFFSSIYIYRREELLWKFRSSHNVGYHHGTLQNVTWKIN